MEIANEERVLSSWLQMLMAVNGEHAVSYIPYNEAVICNILSNTEKEVTATDLCHLMRMQKSQMNRTLNSMEEKGMIRRSRSKKDKRQIYIEFIEGKEGLYAKEHERILKYVNHLLDHFGREKIEEMIELFDYISKIAQEENI